jgi:class 3 adenylate cyclase
MTAANERATQLSAIMFTDIAGYSRLMEEDEQRTIDLLHTHNDIVLPLVEAAGGEVIDAIGDGLFILFPSIRDTVTCATSIQDAVASHNTQAPPGEQFWLRIGIHLGEIWRADDRVYGNGVNIAARVQPCAPPGGICITEDVQRQLAARSEFRIRSIGRRSLKNISRKMELFLAETGHEVEYGDTSETGEDGRDPGDGAPPELDAIKARILEEREKISQRRQSVGASSEGRIESKIYQVVETVMDRAIEKWESLPPEKKAEAVAEISSDKNKRRSAQIKVDIGSEHGEDSSSIGVGLVLGAGFGLGYFSFGVTWMLWPFLLVGVLPFVIGIGKWFRTLYRRERQKKERSVEIQKRLLDLAKHSLGRLTVVQAAGTGEMTLREAQEGLEQMARNGYVVQRRDNDGSVVYEFPGLLPGS